MKTRSKSEMSESAFQKKVLNWLKSIPDCYIVKVVRANRSGVHDIITCHKGKFKSLELKSDYGKMSSLQKIHAHEVRDAGGMFWEVKPANFEMVKWEFLNS